jgi:pimeloyl-ACP methyl ester carboxylesterase
LKPPVVLAHGFTGTSAGTWTESGLLELLREGGREPVPLDLLGHGDQPKPHEPAAYAELEEQYLARAPQGRLDGIGFSMGAATLLWLAAHHPDRFGRLVLAGVGRNLIERDADRAARIAAAVAGEAPGDDTEAQVFARYAREPGSDPEALAALMRRPATPLGDLSRVVADVLVVIGTADFAGPGEPLVEALPQATLGTLPGVDHFATPKAIGFIDATLDFLDAQPF